MVNQIFRLKDILYGVRKHMNVIIGMTVGGLLIGILFFAVQSFSQSDQTTYKIFVSFSVDTANEAGNFTNNMDSPGESDFKLASSLVDWVTYIVRSELVCKTAVEQVNLIGVTTKSVQNALSVTPYGETSIMELVLLWHDAGEGVEIMEAVMDVLPAAIRNTLSVGSVNVIEGPVVTTVSTPVGKTSVILFPALGLLMGLLYCFATMYMRPTLIDVNDVTDLFGVNTLSVIDDDPDFEDFFRENLITNRDNLSSMMKDNFTAFAHILLHQIDDDYFSLFVTSSTAGEGRTMVVANLGVALAALDKRVLLIDFDLTSPTLGSFFMDEVNYNNTVNAVYFDDVSAEDALVRVSPNLYLLMASLDKRHIGIDRFAKKLVAQMETEFDVVILDTPSLGANSDTLYFNSVSPNALYVIRYDYAGCDVIAENIEKLKKSGTSLLGAVINRVPPTGSSLSLSKMASDGDARPSLAARISGKLPFAQRKRSDPPKTNRRIKVPASIDADSFDSDDDLIDPEDYDVFLNTTKPEPNAPAETASAFRRKRTPGLGDDSDDERVARVEAAEAELHAGMRPTTDPGSRLYRSPREAAAPGSTSGEPERQSHAAADQTPAAQDPAYEQREDALYEEEDEDARFERLFGTQIDHFDEDYYDL